MNIVVCVKHVPDAQADRTFNESDSTVENAKLRYLALLSMCDANLGRVLDLMDEKDMWKDTMLVVCTDHGYMLGERGWWGKSVMPWYDETIHTPFFVWDPRSGVAGGPGWGRGSWRRRGWRRDSGRRRRRDARHRGWAGR